MAADDDDVVVVRATGKTLPNGPLDAGGNGVVCLLATPAQAENGESLLSFLKNPEEGYVLKEIKGKRYAWKPLTPDLQVVPRVAHGIHVFLIKDPVLLTHILDTLGREVSATRSASGINADDFELVRKALKIVGPLNEDKDGNELSDNTNVLEQLLGNEQFWDEKYEEQQRVRHCKTVEGWVASKRFHRCIRWVNGNRETVRRKFEGTVSSKNDLVAVMRTFGDLFSQGAVLGVELKRKTLTRRSLRQAHMEFFLWADASCVPFVQLITDMQKGGVAIYCKRIDAVTGIELRQVVLKNMDEVKEFLSNMGDALPDDLGDDGPDGLILPQTLSLPPRKKFKQMEEKTELDSGGGPTQRTGYERATKAQIALWTIGPRFLENDGDVANLADLDSFRQELGEAY